MSAPERIQYLARRNPAFADRAAWVPRWRAHWSLAASRPESATVRRYIQSEVIYDLADPPHDAIGSSDYRSPEDRLRNRGALEYHRIMRADELEVFDGPIAEHAFFSTHHVRWGTGAGPCKVVRFVRRRVPTAEFEPAWAGWADRLRGEPGLLGLAQNVALAGAPHGLDVDGSEELWFADPEAAVAFLLSPTLAEHTVFAPFEVVHAMVAAEVVLKDEG